MLLSFSLCTTPTKYISRNIVFSFWLLLVRVILLMYLADLPAARLSHNRCGDLQTGHICTKKASGPLQHEIHDFIKWVSAEEKSLFWELK